MINFQLNYTLLYYHDCKRMKKDFSLDVKSGAEKEVVLMLGIAWNDILLYL